jgi:hypothetical protein
VEKALMKQAIFPIPKVSGRLFLVKPGKKVSLCETPGTILNVLLAGF